MLKIKTEAKRGENVSEMYFKTYHRKFKEVFTKDVFFKFYSAFKNEIMKATNFRLSKDTYSRIIECFKKRASKEEFYEVFDLAMQELFDFDVELYISMCKYLFSKIENLTDEQYILLEFYALLELEKIQRPFDDFVEGKLKFLIDDYFTQCDDAIEEYFNVTEEAFWKIYEQYEDVELDDLYSKLIEINLENGNFRRAFVNLARALFIQEGVCFYKNADGQIKTYKLKKRAEVY